MSPLRTRRDRATAGGRITPPSPWRLLLLLAGVAALIWYLSTLG